MALIHFHRDYEHVLDEMFALAFKAGTEVELDDEDAVHCVLSGAAKFVHQEDADDFAEALIDFLNEEKSDDETVEKDGDA